MEILRDMSEGIRQGARREWSRWRKWTRGPTIQQLATWDNDGGYLYSANDCYLIDGRLCTGFVAMCRYKFQRAYRLAAYYMKVRTMKHWFARNFSAPSLIGGAMMTAGVSTGTVGATLGMGTTAFAMGETVSIPPRVEASSMISSAEYGSPATTVDASSVSEAVVNVGLTEEERLAIANGLSVVLADTYALYVKTQSFHWNVKGPRFISLHSMFESQYKALAEAIDVLAERIRALGCYAPGSFTEFSRLTAIPESSRQIESADEMIALLVEGHELVVGSAHKIFPLCQQANDDPTLDLLTARMREHEKAAWMLRSLLS